MFEHCEAGSTGDGVRLLARPEHARFRPVLDSVSAAEAAVGVLARSGIPGWMPVAQVLALLTVVPPSGQVAVVVTALQERFLAPEERVTVLALCGRLASWLTAVTDAAIVAVTGPGSAEPDPRDYGRDEVALALRMSTRSSPVRVVQARARRGLLRSVGEALAAGLLTPGMADAAVDELIDAPVDVAELVCERVLPGAAGMSGPQFARALTRAHLVIDAPAGAARHEVAKADRGVWMRPRQDGMADVVTRMTAVEAVTYVRGLDAQARQLIVDYKAAAALAAADESGTVVEVPSIGAARVEVMLGWAEESLADESLPRAHGRRVDVGRR
jgi:hypothetical protein